MAFDAPIFPASENERPDYYLDVIRQEHNKQTMIFAEILHKIKRMDHDEKLEYLLDRFIITRKTID